jgi:phosphoribosylglycinamide formyltransferase-1
MRVGLITYDVPHRKTQEVLLGIHLKRRYELRLLIAPFTPHRNREVVFRHRPEQFTGPSATELSRQLGIPMLPLASETAFESLDICLVLGAGLIKEDSIRDGFILNAHPGLIPLVRGLDSFKWSVLNDHPLGVSLHFIDKEVDKGQLVATERTPVFQSDDIEVLARRHYQLEIMMMIEFERYLDGDRIECFPEGMATKRMSMEREADMLDGFERWKSSHLYPPIVRP